MVDGVGVERKQREAEGLRQGEKRSKPERPVDFSTPRCRRFEDSALQRQLLMKADRKDNYQGQKKHFEQLEKGDRRKEFSHSI